MKIAFSVFKSSALNYSYQIYQKIGQKWKFLWLVFGNATFLAQTLLYFWAFLHFKIRAITQKLNEKFHLTHRQNGAYYALKNLEITSYKESNLLNEIVSNCRHQSKYAAARYETKDLNDVRLIENTKLELVKHETLINNIKYWLSFMVYIQLHSCNSNPQSSNFCSNYMSFQIIGIQIILAKFWKK